MTAAMTVAVAARIRAARRAAGLTQAQLAERLELHQGNVSVLESGRIEPRLSTLRRIAEACNCSLVSLLA